jgi:hypothetical protein
MLTVPYTDNSDPFAGGATKQSLLRLMNDRSAHTRQPKAQPVASHTSGTLADAARTLQSSASKYRPVYIAG